MHLSIDGSVGFKGLNQSKDVKLIQTLLNCYIAQFTPSLLLEPDGKCGSLTINAIFDYQRNVLKFKNPDGLVQSNKRTFNSLTMAYTVSEQEKVAAHQKKWISWEKLFQHLSPKVKAQGPLIYRVDNYSAFKVTYKSSLSQSKRLVSEYSKNVIKMALKEAGMPAAVITSTFRTPKEQASIMYRHAQKNYQAQVKLYGREGDKVLAVYKANSSKDKNTVINLMEQKIKDLLKLNLITSKHCATPAAYGKRNIIDIGVNSTRAVCGQEYHQEKLTNAFSYLKKEGYIENFIDETNKSNECWHLEIIPNKKAIL